MGKKKILIGVSMTLLILGALGVYLVMNDFQALRSLSRTNSEFWCERQGGSYSCAEGCYCSRPTSDAGKACADSDQCEGLCLAVRKQTTSNNPGNSRIEIITGDPLNPDDYEPEGVCSKTTNTLGAHNVVENGQPRSTLTID